MPKLSEVLFGKRDKTKQLSTQSETQKRMQRLINQGLVKGEGPLADLFGEFDEDAFNQGVRDPELKHFEENVLPLLQEKFIKNNQVLSSAFGREQLKAGTDLQSKLAQLLYQAREQQKQNRMSGINSTMGNQAVENIYKKGTTGAVPGFFQAVAEGAGQEFGKAGAKAVVG